MKSLLSNSTRLKLLGSYSTVDTEKYEILICKALTENY